jgi:hypothetical protein
VVAKPRKLTTTLLKTILKEINMINSYLNIEQENRVRQGLEARDNEASLMTQLYTAGDFDGVIGIEPDPHSWSNLAYRSGFLAGLGRYYDQKYKVDIEVEPF